MQLLLPATVLMLSFNHVHTLPTAQNSEIVPRASLHTCSVLIQRWCKVGAGGCDEPFDTYYYNAAPTSAFNWVVDPWLTQTSMNINVPSVGSELVPEQVGSNILHIIDTADSTSSTDPGKFSFVWGSQSWNSFSAGNPCIVRAPGSSSGAWETQCTFQCDCATAGGGKCTA